MIRIQMSAQGLSHTRLATSPLLEAVESLRVLAQPRRLPVAAPWVRRASAALRGHDLELLTSLVTPTGWWIPDFLAPRPTGNSPGSCAGIDQLLALVAAAPAEQVRFDLDLLFRGRPLPASIVAATPGGAQALKRRRRPLPAVVAAALGDGEATFARRVADSLATYWDRALAPEWSSIKQVLDHDIRYRAARLAAHGFAGLFADLHPDLRWDPERLELVVDRPCQRARCATSMLLVPSVFSWPRTSVCAEAGQPSVCYPARGIAALWDDRHRHAARALADLLGVTRAALLADLDGGRTTTELAVRHDLTPGAVSYHLVALYRAGLVDRAREGLQVRYRLTQHGSWLLDHNHVL
jgi:DNA-binding transcriptional ArsR family regulator